jgi:DNA-binding MarR family transcriptional regulator
LLPRQPTMRIKIEDSLAYRVYRTARLLRKHLLAMAATLDLDLTPEQWFVLNKLRNQDGRSQVELGDAIFADRPNLTRLLTAMEEKRWVRRENDPEDGRRMLVHLTAEGRKVHDRLEVEVPTQRSRVFEGISEREIHTVMRVLTQLEENLERDL